uniref:Uncharacterized protein n=1 Tax=Heterorhabditis bacteriophora TaxID=37862 RepID=A0A1I7X6T7_HETBA
MGTVVELSIPYLFTVFDYLDDFPLLVDDLFRPQLNAYNAFIRFSFMFVTLYKAVPSFTFSVN